jgi:hypothetical protein
MREQFRLRYVRADRRLADAVVVLRAATPRALKR